jgi:hypothetical protein
VDEERGWRKKRKEDEQFFGDLGGFDGIRLGYLLI